MSQQNNSAGLTRSIGTMEIVVAGALEATVITLVLLKLRTRKKVQRNKEISPIQNNTTAVLAVEQSTIFNEKQGDTNV